jgi:hypothetical protein
MRSIYDDDLTIPEQYWHFAKQEREWAGSAFRDISYNKKEAKRFDTEGKKILAAMHWQEAEWCNSWYARRLLLAEKQEQLGGFSKISAVKEKIKELYTGRYISRFTKSLHVWKKMSAADQHRHVAELQREWAANALRDANYNKKQSELFKSKKKFILAKMYQQEYEWSIFWYNRRIRIAEKNERLIK